MKFRNFSNSKKCNSWENYMVNSCYIEFQRKQREVQNIEKLEILNFIKNLKKKLNNLK